MRGPMILVTAVLAVVAPTTSQADNWGVGAKINTLGFGVEIARPFTPLFTARFGLNMLDYSYSGTESEVDYDFDARLRSASFALDWHPIATGFRLSGGVLYNGNQVDGLGTSLTDYIIGGISFPADEVGNLTGNVQFEDFSPFFGIGWDQKLDPLGKFRLLIDFGVVYQGEPQVSLTADGPISSVPTFQQALAQEQAELQEELSVYKWYPAIGLGFRYSF